MKYTASERIASLEMQIVGLEQQRDELLAALKGLVSFEHGYITRPMQEQIRQAEAAIAKAEGSGQ
jgi:hypothetical protein